MKVVLILAALVVLAIPARAETIINPAYPNTTLIIPDGSTVVSDFVIPCCTYGPLPAYGVNFTFDGGYGKAYGESDDADVGSITFTNPVTNLSIKWLSTTNPLLVSASNGFLFTCEQMFANCSGSEDFGSAVITGLGFLGYAPGSDGISSMSFTVVPEASTLAMLGLGLIGLWAVVKVFREVGRSETSRPAVSS